MLSCLLIKSQSRSEIALLFFQYNSTVITTTIITTIPDSVRTVLRPVIQASALYYDIITYDVIKLLPSLEQGLPPCCPPCKMNLVTPLLMIKLSEIARRRKIFKCPIFQAAFVVLSDCLQMEWKKYSGIRPFAL